MQILVDLAAQFDRRVAFVGRGVIENSRDRAAARVPADPGRRADSRQRRPQLPVAGRRVHLHRVAGRAAGGAAADRHRRPSAREAGPDDVVVFSAREIPGNEKAIGRVMNHIARRDAEVIYRGDQARPRVRARQRGRAEAHAFAGQAAALRADTWGVPAARPACPGRRPGVAVDQGAAGRERRRHPFRRRGGAACRQGAGRPDPDRRHAQRRGRRRGAARPAAPGGRRPGRPGRRRSASSPGRSRRRRT